MYSYNCYSVEILATMTVGESLVLLEIKVKFKLKVTNIPPALADKLQNLLPMITQPFHPDGLSHIVY